MTHTVKGFGIVNKAEVDIFLELSCFFDDSVDVGNLISGSFAFCKSRLNIWKFSVHVLLKPRLQNFEHYFASLWDECNCTVVWAFVGIAFLWDWNENWPFPVLWPLLSFPNVLAYWAQHCVSGSEQKILQAFPFRSFIREDCLFPPSLFSFNKHPPNTCVVSGMFRLHRYRCCYHGCCIHVVISTLSLRLRLKEVLTSTPVSNQDVIGSSK